MVLMISTQEFEGYVERCDDEEDYCTFTRDGTGICRSGNASGLNASHALVSYIDQVRTSSSIELRQLAYTSDRLHPAGSNARSMVNSKAELKGWSEGWLKDKLLGWLEGELERWLKGRLEY